MRLRLSLILVAVACLSTLSVSVGRAALPPACTVTWKAAVATGFWDVATNWEEGRVPGLAGDVACIAAGNTVTYRSATTTLMTVLSQGTLNVTGGTLNTTGTDPNNSTIATLNLSSGSLGGAGQRAVATLNWTGGTIQDAGTTTVTTFSKTGANTVFLAMGTILDIGGTGTWTGGPMGCSGSPGSTLRVSGTLAPPSGGLGCGAQDIIDIESTGTLTLNGDFTVASRLDIDGQLIVTAGTPMVPKTTQLQGAPVDQHAGEVLVGADAYLSASGNMPLAPSGSIGGAGSFAQSGGTLTVPPLADLTTARFSVAAGAAATLDGQPTTPHVFAVVSTDGGGLFSAILGGTRNWSTATYAAAGGTLTGPYTATVTTNFNKGLPNDLILDGGVTLQVPDSGWFSQNICVKGGATFRLAGELSVPAGTTFTCSGGTVDVAQPNGALTFESATRTIGPLLSAGDQVVLQGGTTTLAGGATVAGGGRLEGPGALTLQGGVLSGTGVVTANVSNTGGTLAPGSSPGRLHLEGNYSQGPGGTIAIELNGPAPDTQFDVLEVGGTSTLDGTLAITQGFVPSLASAFGFLTAGSRAGTFATVSGGTVSDGRSYAVNYLANGAQLTIPGASPSPPPPPPPISPPPAPPPPHPAAPPVARCVVPNVKGKTLRQARSLLTAKRCLVGRVTRAYSRKLKSGRVISQSRRPGARLPRRTKVNLVLSRGRRR